MKAKNKKSDENGRQKDKGEKKNPDGYPEYPDKEDIYIKYREEKEVDPEDTLLVKPTNKMRRNITENEKDFDDDMTGEDLDIPGSELDDDQEFIGSEDEENNYYSLGDDDHKDLEEDNEE